MTVYVYDSTLGINLFSTDDFGVLGDTPTSSENFGAWDGSFDAEGFDFSLTSEADDFSVNSALLASPTLVQSSTTTEDWYLITVDQTILPFGAITTSEIENAQVLITNVFNGDGTLLSLGTLDTNVTFVWAGNGTLFEIGSGLERTVSPYVSSGTLRFTKSIFNLSGIGFASNNTDYDFSSTDQDYSIDSDSAAIVSFVSNPPEDKASFKIVEGIFGYYFNSTYGDYSLTDQDFSLNYRYDALVEFSANPPENTQLFTISGSKIESSVNSYVGLGTLSLSSTGEEAFLPTYVGSGTLSISGTGLKSLIISPAKNNSLYTISGSFSNLKLTDTETGSGTIDLYGILDESNTYSYFGSDTIQISGTADESFSPSPYDGSGTLSISGTGFDSLTANPEEDNLLYTISGSYSDLNFTKPVVGLGTLTTSGSFSNLKLVKSDSGLGTTRFKTGIFNTSRATFDSSSNLRDFSSTNLDFSIDDKYDAYVTFTANIKNTQLFNVVGSATNSNVRIIPKTSIGGTVFIIDAESNYYSPIYPRNSGDPQSGTGTIRVNDDQELTYYSAIIPYSARGTISLVGTADKSFLRTNYSGSGRANFSGIASTREINVYTYVGLGTFIGLSNSIREKNRESYVGDGLIYLGKRPISTFDSSYTTFDRTDITFDNGNGFKDSEASYREVTTYSGSGNLTVSSTAKQSYTKQSPQQTQLFNISGSGFDSYSAQTPETTSLYEFSGSSLENVVYVYEGSGSITLGSDAIPILKLTALTGGLFRFASHVCDTIYDTCDSTELTSDNQYSAFVNFVSNPPEDTQLFSISGSALTKEIDVFTDSGSGTVGISGYFNIKTTNSFLGFGSINILQSGVQRNINSYIGSGSINISSESGNSTSIIVPINSRVSFDSSNYKFSSTNEDFSIVEIGIFNISGSSSSRIIKVKEYSGIGTVFVSVSSSTKILSRPSYNGDGTVYISGELVHPDIRYIPASKGFGFIDIIGSGKDNIIHNYSNTSGSLFTFSNGFESLSRSPYVGLGTIYLQSTSAESINNPYQPPRVYVTII
jgi:hypothetical protein